MEKKKINFLGSKPIGYKCFEFLISKANELNYSITGLLTHTRTEFGNDYNITELAHKNNIPIYSNLDSMPECDIIYSVQYHELLKQEHINKAKQVALNLHMAPLPEYRGSNQFSFAIIDGKKEFGTTIHKISVGIDSGAILFQKRFPIPENCWVNTLYELTFSASVKLFQQTLKHIIEGNYQPMEQDLLINKYGTNFHYRKEIAQLKIIDLKWEQEKIERYIRAVAMPGFEQPYCLINGEKVYFVKK